MGQSSFCCCSESSSTANERNLSEIISFPKPQRNIESLVSKEELKATEQKENVYYEEQPIQASQMTQKSFSFLLMKVLSSHCSFFTKNTILRFGASGLQSVTTSEGSLTHNKSTINTTRPQIITRNKKASSELGNNGFVVSLSPENRIGSNKEENKSHLPIFSNGHHFKRNPLSSMGIREDQCMKQPGFGGPRRSTAFGKSPNPKEIFRILDGADSEEDKGGLLFRISFNPETQKYSLMDYGNGLGCFMMITKPTSLRQSELISIGSEVFLVLNIDPFTNELKAELFEGEEDEIYEKNDKIRETGNRVESLSDSQNDLMKIGSSKMATLNEDYSPRVNFNQSSFARVSTFEAVEGKTIRIGRGSSCEIKTGRMMSVSGCHCRLIYIGGRWIIDDGPELGKPSTNGTWRGLFEETTISDGIMLKIQGVLFICSMSQEDLFKE